jgi:hypothetical protein
VVYPVLTNEEMTYESQPYNCFTRNRGNAILKYARPEVKGTSPTTGLTCSETVTHSGEILNTGKSNGKKRDRFFFLMNAWKLEPYHDLNMQIGILEG